MGAVNLFYPWSIQNKKLKKKKTVLNGCMYFFIFPMYDLLRENQPLSIFYQNTVEAHINPFTGEFMVTVSDINGLFFLFFLYKIHSKTGI